MLNPSYLTLSEYQVYHFRWPIPQHLLTDGKRRYCKLSLGTREPTEALHLGKVLSCRAALLANREELKGMDYIELKQIVQTYLQRTLAQAKEDMEWRGEDKKATNAAQLIADNTLDVWELVAGSEEETKYLEHICNVMEIPELVGTEPEWNRLRECFRNAYPQFAKAMIDQRDKINRFDFDPSPALIEATATVLPSSDYKLKAIVEKYVATHVSDAAWDENTREGKEAILNILIELLGTDKDIAAIDAKTARTVRDDIKRIPKNRRKNPLVRDLPLRKAMDLPNVDCITGVTVSKYFNTVRSLFDWCVNEEYITRNPFSTLKISVDKKRKKSDRTAYTPEQIRAICSAVKPDGIHYRYWGTMIGIYTGARLNEICQLELTDIKQHEGIWHFSLNDENGKSLKTAAAKRLVPIHPALLKLGILEEKERLAKAGHVRFLHELTYCKKNKYGKKLGHFVNEVLLPQLGIKEGKHKEVFHAFRHTVNTRLHQANVPQPIIEALIGHERSGTSQQVYFQEGYKLSQLKDAMDKYDPLAA